MSWLLEIMEKVACPVMLCPAQGDVDCQPFMDNILSKKPFGEKCYHKRYDSQMYA